MSRTWCDRRCFGLGGALLAGVSLIASPVAQASGGAKARAELVNDSGKTVGRADFVETPSGLLMTLQVSGASPGVHALHIHETGRCDAPSFESAGGHFNPDSRSHGYQSGKGPHAGDLPNIHVPDTRALKAEILAPGLTLRSGARSVLDADGSALMIHAGPDDYRSDPAGESGSRVACGVIEGA